MNIREILPRLRVLRTELLPSRVYMAQVYGDVAPEMERKALDQARRFFGSDVNLYVVPDYICMGTGKSEPGNTRSAQITVREIG
jgi:hypothetical protein